MSQLWDLVQQHIDEYGPSEAEIARRMGTSPQTLNSWKNRGLRRLPEKRLLEALATVVRKPYEVVLTAALADSHYLHFTESYRRSYVVTQSFERPDKTDTRHGSSPVITVEREVLGQPLYVTVSRQDGEPVTRTDADAAAFLLNTEEVQQAAISNVTRLLARLSPDQIDRLTRGEDPEEVLAPKPLPGTSDFTHENPISINSRRAFDSAPEEGVLGAPVRRVARREPTEKPDAD